MKYANKLIRGLKIDSPLTTLGLTLKVDLLKKKNKHVPVRYY